MTISSFRELSLSPSLLTALDAAGYETPTPIQAGTIAAALAGRDVIGMAQTGTGKTAAFLLPTIERLREARAAGERASALVLAPTRELAEQIHGWAVRFGGDLRSALVVGGLGYEPQRAALKRDPALVIATPGRLVDFIEQRSAPLGDVRILVLDEADRMLDMGFKPQLDKIMRALPPSRQTLLFSATIADDLSALTRMHLHQPVRVAVGPQSTTPSRAEQDVYLVEREGKTPLLLSLIEESGGTMLVFARTKHRTDRLARAIRNAGHAAQRIHADRSQSQRREALEGFRAGRYRILIATDIAARGIDVAGIGRVINYDLPMTVEDYVHRIGRTARAEASGHATSFAAPEERGQLSAIERHIGSSLPRRHSTAAAAPAPRPHVPAPGNAERTMAMPPPARRVRSFSRGRFGRDAARASR